MSRSPLGTLKIDVDRLGVVGLESTSRQLEVMPRPMRIPSRISQPRSHRLSPPLDSRLSTTPAQLLPLQRAEADSAHARPEVLHLRGVPL